MKRDRGNGRTTLESPDDYREFSHAGVHFFRTTQLHERGVYRARVTASGRKYLVTGGHTKRYPWRAVANRGVAIAGRNNFRDAGGYANLIEAAEGIARWDSLMYASQPMEANDAEIQTA
jgi:hypothetical protein